MKNKKIMLLPLLALMGLTVVSCGEKTSPNQSNETFSDTEKQTQSDKKSDSEEKKEETKYQVNFNKSDKVNVTLEDNKVLPGSEVSFSVSSTEEEILSVTSSIAHLDFENGVFYFTMPSQDVTIDIVSESYGDPSILEVSDVDITSLPNNVASFKTYMEKSMAAEGNLFSSAHVINNNFHGMTAWYDYTAKGGKNDVVLVSGHKKSNLTDTTSTYYSQEIGKQNDFYYSITSTSSLGSTTNTVSNEYTFKNIISDDAESVGLTEIKESDAKRGYSSFQGAKVINDFFFSSDRDSFTLNDWPENPTDNTYYLKDLEKTISDDKKSVHFDLTAYYWSWSSTKVFDIKLDFDGDYFMTKAEITNTSYDSEDCDSTTNLPKEGAVGTVKGTYSLDMNRGYKSTLDKTDISEFAMNDYDVDITYTLEGDEVKTDSKDVVVKNGSTLEFAFSSHDDKPTLITPTLKRVEEGEGYVDLDKLKVLKEGDMTLVFDNGFGEEKLVKITSVRPAASSISIDGPSNVYLNGTAPMTVAILPEKANQNVTFTKNENSVGDVEITKNVDGTYSVKGTKLGEVTYTVTCDENAEIKKDVTFNVIEKPNAATFKNNLLTKTFYGTSSSFRAVVNFNEDGTGSYKTGGMYYYQDEASFNWTFDEDSLIVTISGAEGSYYTTRGFISFAPASDDTADATFVEYGFYGDVTSIKVTLTAQERKDMSDFN